MVNFLSQENHLSTLDFNLLPNFNNINSIYKNLTFDTNNAHSVPYFWGTVGIMYNKAELAEIGVNESELNDWNILWDDRFGDNNIEVYQSVRDVFMFALKSSGKSANTTNTAEIDAAKQKLIDLNQINKLKFATDTIKIDVVEGNAVLGITFNGDFLNMYSELKAEGSEINIGWAFPNQGTNKWYDNFVIPNVSENKELAHEFINFFLDEKVSYYNTLYVGYSTPNKEALELLKVDDVFKDIVALPAYQPSNEMIEKSEAYTYPGSTLFDYYNNSFQQFRNE
jgi:spermidine/putrescine transport system substrate-binding protein